MSHPIWSHWLYSRLVCVPFYDASAPELMSHLMRNYHARIPHRRPIFLLPCIRRTGAARVEDRGMVAGNVSLYGGTFEPAGRPDPSGRIGGSDQPCILQAEPALKSTLLAT